MLTVGLVNINLKKSFVLLGNHDFPFSRSPFAKLKNAIYLQNENYEFEGVKFFGSPQQLPFYGAFNSPESCLERIYKKCDKDVDVLITHTPPYGVLDESSRGVKIGSKSLMSLFILVMGSLITELLDFLMHHNVGSDYVVNLKSLTDEEHRDLIRCGNTP
jgi:hypothetical protein